jgi:hypothetical protein
MLIIVLLETLRPDLRVFDSLFAKLANLASLNFFEKLHGASDAFAGVKVPLLEIRGGMFTPLNLFDAVSWQIGRPFKVESYDSWDVNELGVGLQFVHVHYKFRNQAHPSFPTYHIFRKLLKSPPIEVIVNIHLEIVRVTLLRTSAVIAKHLVPLPKNRPLPGWVVFSRLKNDSALERFVKVIDVLLVHVFLSLSVIVEGAILGLMVEVRALHTHVLIERN